MRRRWGKQLAAAVVALALAVVVTPPTAAAPAARTATEGIRVQTSVTYRVDPAVPVVDVVVRLTVTNTQSDQVRGDQLLRPYLDAYTVPVLAEAEGLAATTDGRTQPVTRVQEGASVVGARIDLVPDLFAGQTRHIELRYHLPARPPRSGGFSRVNPAYVTFPAFMPGDPGAVDIEVVVPTGFEVDLVGDPMERSEDGGMAVYRATAIEDPEEFLTDVVVRDDEALVAVPVEVADTSLTVLAWPGDGEWAAFVAERVERGVPVLEELVGLPWPGDDDLEVVETASPYLYGYAGWYSPAESVVVVGDELDATVVLHELSHLWFNHELFEERWINEGLAEVFATAALVELGDEVPPPPELDPTSPGRIALAEWSDPDLSQPISEAQETYGYAASRAVIQAVADEIGLDALSLVVVAAHSREIPYRGDGPTLRYDGSLGWQELLDLLDEVGGATTAVAVFADLVVADAHRSELDERAAARARYAELVAAGEGWTAPKGLRLAMAEWSFDTAGELVDAAVEALEVRAAVDEVLAGSGVELPAALERGYEEAGSAGELAASITGVLDAAEAVVDAVEAEGRASGLLALVGLIGSGGDDHLADALTAFDEGDYDAAVGFARAAVDAYDGAAADGALRLAAAAVGVLALTGLWVWRRRARRARGEGDGESEVADVVRAPGIS